MNAYRPWVEPVGPVRPARTYKEVAAIMSDRGMPMTKQAVYQHEKNAMAKLRSSPEILKLAFELGILAQEESHVRQP